MRNFYCFLLAGIFLNCSEPDDIQIKKSGGLEQPKAMNTYCQRSPGEILYRFEYEYEHNKLKFVLDFRGGVMYSKTSYQYDDGLLTKESFESDFEFSEKDYIYNTKGQLMNIILNIKSYNVEGDLESEAEYEAPLEYDVDLLVKKWDFWGAYQTYEYEDGSIATEYFYSNNGDLTYVLHNKYKNGLIIEEKTIDASGLNSAVKEFSYDNRQRLTKITSEGNVLEENVYVENRIIEKETFYFGIDPGFDLCYGNYLYTYDY